MHSRKCMKRKERFFLGERRGESQNGKRLLVMLEDFWLEIPILPPVFSSRKNVRDAKSHKSANKDLRHTELGRVYGGWEMVGQERRGWPPPPPVFL